MHIFGYIVIGFLIVCMLLAATKALSVANAMTTAVADIAQVVAPETTQSPRRLRVRYCSSKIKLTARKRDRKNSPKRRRTY